MTNLFTQLSKEEENKISDHLESLSGGISWDNWQEVDDEGDETDEYVKLWEVMYSKLEWIKEFLISAVGEDIEKSEYIQIINDLQEHVCPILSTLDKN